MIIYGLPPAVSAPATPCADAKPQMFFVRSTVVRSPDCHWLIAYKAEGEKPPSLRVDRPLVDDVAILADARTGRTMARFEMARVAIVHWLKDGHHLIVNYQESTDGFRPLAFILPGRQGQRPVDLRTLVLPDAARRTRIPVRHLAYIFSDYISDDGARVTISVDFRFPKTKAEKDPFGYTGEKCFVYSVDKAGFRRYRFVREVPVSACPTNPDEH